MTSGLAAAPVRTLARRITLTAREASLCSLLKEVALAPRTDEAPADAAHQRSKEKPVVCRITGGWVRDKLLGSDSDDIDIALDTMMGYEFALLVKKHLRRPEVAAKYLPPSEANGKDATLAEENDEDYLAARIAAEQHVARIRSNPDRSKHLETAACKILGYHLDFVNLRAETYAADSRIPNEVRFGTPLEDALRRDCTINSLFYNIMTGEVEDFTKRGMLDLEEGVIRTPLEPRQTFIDDPLRVLRSFRFAARFGFKIDETLFKSASDAEILLHLASKISKERIGTELTKMLEGPDPTHALSLLSQSGAMRVLCTSKCSLDGQPVPGLKRGIPCPAKLPSAVDKETVSIAKEKDDSIDTTYGNAHKLSAVVDWLASSEGNEHANFGTKILASANLYMSALLQSLHARLMATENACLEDAGEAVAHLIKYHFKLSAKQADSARYLVHGAYVFSLFVNGNETILENVSAVKDDKLVSRRVQLARLVRLVCEKPSSACNLAEMALMATAFESVGSANFFRTANGRISLDFGTESKAQFIKTIKENAKKYQELLRELSEEDMTEVWSAKPLLDGNELREQLNVVGRTCRPVQSLILDWMVENPNATKDECAKWLKEGADGKMAKVAALFPVPEPSKKKARYVR